MDIPRSKLFELVRSRRPEMFLGKVALKICSKFTGEHPCRSLISIKLLKNIFSLEHLCTVASELAVQLTYDSSVPCVIEMTAIRIIVIKSVKIVEPNRPFFLYNLSSDNY